MYHKRVDYDYTYIMDQIKGEKVQESTQKYPTLQNIWGKCKFKFKQDSDKFLKIYRDSASFLARHKSVL